jgi:hypothetical protein
VPLSPQLTRVISRPNGTSLRLTWSDEKFIRTGYRIYASDDGVNFGAPIEVDANVHGYNDGGIPQGLKRYYKVSVVGAGGESKPSRIYGAQTGGAARVLIVDGNDRWQFQTAENPYCTNHNFAAIAGRNISGVVFETANHNAVIDGTVALTNYPAVVWLLGEESTADRTFDSVEQSLVMSYLNAGGHLFVSGAEIGWDLDRDSGPTAADRAFYRNYLRATLGGNANDDADTYSFAPAPNGIFAGNPSSGFDNGTRGTYNVDFPDVLTPTNGSVPAILYVGGRGGAAAVQYDGSSGGGKVVNFGFPFETITNSVVRDAYMSDVLRFFGVLEPPALQRPAIDLAQNTITLTWNASAGLKYRVQFKDGLPGDAWQTLTGDIMATNTAASAQDVLISATGQRFYRVLLVD